MSEPTPTLEQDVISVAAWLYRKYTRNVMSDWDDLNDEGGITDDGPVGKLPWLQDARELIASNIGTGAISAHFVAQPYAEVICQALLKEWTYDELAEMHSFSDLHGKCDANQYLIDYGPDLLEPPNDEVSLIWINAVTDIVDRWLRDEAWRPDGPKDRWPANHAEQELHNQWREAVRVNGTVLGFRDWIRETR